MSVDLSSSTDPREFPLSSRTFAEILLHVLGIVEDLSREVGLGNAVGIEHCQLPDSSSHQCLRDGSSRSSEADEEDPKLAKRSIEVRSRGSDPLRPDVSVHEASPP